MMARTTDQGTEWMGARATQENLDGRLRAIHNFIYANDGIKQHARVTDELVKLLYVKLEDERQGESDFVLRGGRGKRQSESTLSSSQPRNATASSKSSNPTSASAFPPNRSSSLFASFKAPGSGSRILRASLSRRCSDLRCAWSLGSSSLPIQSSGSSSS